MDFKDFVNKMNRPVLVSDSRLNLMFLNQSAATLFKVSESQWKSQSLTQLLVIRQEDQIKLNQAITDLKSIRLSVFLKSQEQANELIEKKIYCQPFGHKTSGIGYYAFQLEEQVESTISLQTVKNLGQMTGELAHALSNPLAVIQINCDTLDLECQKTKTLKSEVVQLKVSKIGTALNRVNMENSRLKGLSRKLSSADETNLDDLLPSTTEDFSH